MFICVNILDDPIEIAEADRQQQIDDMENYLSCKYI